MASVFNASHVEFDGHLFNSSLLNLYNYTIWGNGTVSNATNCYLVFNQYDPYFYDNGTVVNTTQCDTPINPIALRGFLGIAFSVLFAIVLICALTGLAKHGRMYLPAEKNFRLVSRRWAWYWVTVTAAVSIISGFTSIDVNRDYLQGSGLILQNIFYYISLPATLAAVWEMVRHWGSFCERKLVDEDPFRFSHEDRRSKIEFYLPLVFYLFGFMTFFLSVLRSWTSISKASWSPDITTGIHTATDGAFKASSLFAFFAFLVIPVSITNTLHYYAGVSRPMPAKIPLCLGFILVRIVYNIAVAWDYNIGPLKFNAPVAYIYALGYLPTLMCMVVMCVWAWLEPNEDIVIKQLRAQREARSNHDLRIGLRDAKETVDSEQMNRSQIVTIGDRKDVVKRESLPGGDSRLYNSFKL